MWNNIKKRFWRKFVFKLCVLPFFLLIMLFAFVVSVGRNAKFSPTSNSLFSPGSMCLVEFGNIHIKGKVMALEGDIIDYNIEENLVMINDKPLYDTEVVSSRVFPVKVKKNEAWLLFQNLKDYDLCCLVPVPLNLLSPEGGRE